VIKLNQRRLSILWNRYKGSQKKTQQKNGNQDGKIESQNYKKSRTQYTLSQNLFL